MRRAQFQLDPKGTVQYNRASSARASRGSVEPGGGRGALIVIAVAVTVVSCIAALAVASAATASLSSPRGKGRR